MPITDLGSHYCLDDKYFASKWIVLLLVCRGRRRRGWVGVCLYGRTGKVPDNASCVSYLLVHCRRRCRRRRPMSYDVVTFSLAIACRKLSSFHPSNVY